ncbi:MAG: hypothetical protein Q8J99_11515 [Sulfuritalea sp.]|nr:hypothetical protein [Sulfuritalea sp.]
MKSPRLAWALAISLALHLCLGWLLSPQSATFLPRSKAVTLTVALATREHGGNLPPAAPESAPVAPSTRAAQSTSTAPDPAGSLTQKARFLVAPDLAPLEEIAVPASGQLTLRLHVSALGTVDRVVVVASDPIPGELLDGLLARFRQAQLAPARTGSRAVASTLDLVIRFEAAPVRESREP